MRQQLITWLIEDIAPDIRRNGDPEGVILKFATAQNLEPALVQSLGQLYNTAKTLAYMEKSANRGGSFPLLDVDAMVDKYLQVHTKSARAKVYGVKGMTAYDQFACDRAGLPAYFDNIPGLKVEMETYEEQPQKSAAHSVREQLRTEDEVRYNLEQLAQAKMEFEEDARVLLTKMAAKIKQDEINFENLEQDALWVHGEGVKPSLDLLAAYCENVHVKVARAKDAGTKRLVGNQELLNQIDQVWDCLLKRATAAAEEKEVQESRPERSEKPRLPKVPMTNDPAMDIGSASTPPPPDKTPKPTAGKPSDKPTSNPKPPVNSREVSTFTGNVGKLHSLAQGFLGSGFNSAQQHVDTAHLDAQHTALLQNLMTTDTVLADADPDKVVSMYNTLRRAAPSIAGDPNVVRVALRSMIQHDGVSPFDVKGFLDTESASQKTDYNKRLLDEMDYGGAGFKPSPSPKPQT